MAKRWNETNAGSRILMESNDRAKWNRSNEDLSILPIDKDGIGICKKCGKIDIKRKFVGSDKSFCTKYCARFFGVFNGGNQNHNNNKSGRTLEYKKNTTHRFVLMEESQRLEGMIPMEPLPQLAKPWLTDLDNFTQPVTSKYSHVTDSYEWSNELFGCDFLAAPVKLFRHAPLNEMWDETFEQMKVEVRNKDCDNLKESLSDYFWVATILKVKGYMGLLRYEGFGSDDSKDFWVNLCCSEVHQVGWCATRGKPLIPPKSIEGKYSDWKRFLVKQLTGARTLPANFYLKFSDSLKSRFEPGMAMEVVDKNCISQVKVANVVEIVGKRLHVKYYDNTPEDMGFWCHEDSPLIHHVGWAFKVGHMLEAPAEYIHRVKLGLVDGRDTMPHHFPLHSEWESLEPIFEEGMKLEAIDPLNLSSVCAATVMRVMSGGHMMIRVDCYPADANGSDWFCYHQRSPCIFPVGFCAANNIVLKPPAGYEAIKFDWEQYLEETGAIAAKPELFTSTQCRSHHGFVAGMKLECADLMDPRLVCVATVARVVGNLLKVHFDGWGDEYDQWLGGGSTDVYPVGWCRAVGHKLEGPNKPNVVVPPKPKPKKMRKRKSHHPIVKTVNKSGNEATTPSSEASVDNDTTTTDSKYPSEASQSPKNAVKAEPSPVHNHISDPSPKKDEKLDDIHMDSANSLPSAEVESESVSVDTEDFPRPEESIQSKGEKLPITDDDIDISNVDDLIDDDCSNDTEEDKVIPRLVGNVNVSPDILSAVDPESWTSADVSRFLTVNDCSTYRINFAHIDGKMLLELTKDKIIEILEMKVGPSLKIFDLINQLKCKLKPVQTRLKSGFK